ncbi:type ISP restriction/modification enzyme [Caenimonas aquaedulcis]|uniref:site-specific DNA-methyltransferase (adenine-specific) n=1 Tax=Caenimonas aquaedulcis TaxID=2793270 RepID=A0A931H5H2_9BURK|nr:type ISP restriction/modification enzyme [Caenimonas aquaedulcis]MBG9389005.1 hypothetical protein [Caenimonas aquaedulcis]
MATRVAPQDPLIERLRSATSITSLVRYLHDELNWPVDLEAIDDAFYDYEPEELGIKPEHQVAIKTIKQLRPLTSGQPWGIFFVEFDKQRLPMVVLRRVLQGLSLRNREKDKGRQRWHAQDLLFISSFGPANDREIALAHFTDESDRGDLPTLRVLGWDGADTNLALAGVANTMRDHLRWPPDGDTPQGQQRWRQRWSSAFRLRYREAVTTAKDLALALAYLARAIRTRANEVLAVEGPSGPLTALYQAFKANLMADLTHDRFADMYAQTITYGLFAARVSRSSGGLVADDAALMIPSTNPFLQDLLQDFLAASGRSRMKGRARGTGIDFDELGVNAVVEQLRQAPMDAVLVSFNNARPGDDPVIHFYEDFLTAYDNAMRVERGVFYTPKPVVQFIVRSVHEVLQNEFGIEDGLASTITWGEMLRRKPGLELPAGTLAESAFVQILDPAVGTATFLVEFIDLIHRHMLVKWQKAGQSKAQQLELWNTYVRDHLLTRMHGFELMMAPYAIAHMKLGLKLADTGYRFPEGGPRVRVFLTNSLQPATDVQPQFELMAPMLAHEARAANAVKQHLATTVVIGNPPYSGHSVNNNVAEAVEAVHDYRRGYPDLQKPGQAKWLQNDYVKFIRFAEQRVVQARAGVLGFITDHSYLDNPTFKGMRRHLMDTFGAIWVVDLHGNSKKKEKAEDGSKDENVFDITQGAAVALYARCSGLASAVRSLDVLGMRSSKYERLATMSLHGEKPETLEPNAPFWLFKPQAQVGRAEYEAGWGLPTIFSPNGDPAPGIVTTHDEFAISWDAKNARQKVEALLATRSEDEARQLFQLCTQSQWSYDRAKRELATGAWKRRIVPVLYRPFDDRVTIYDSNVAVHRRERATAHFLAGPNVGISVPRATEIPGIYQHVFCSTKITQHHTVSLKEVNYIFPLWLYHPDGDRRDLHETDLVSALPNRSPNLDVRFIRSLRDAMGLTDFDWHAEKQGAALNAEKVFQYLYAVLHSPSYRQRYGQFLKGDFPRIPIPASRTAFDDLSRLGKQLLEWHSLTHPVALAITRNEQPRGTDLPSFFGNARALDQVGEKSRGLADIRATKDGPVGKVRISTTSGFDGVLESVWQHSVGGYQVLHKWLDDRRKASRSLSDEDIAHWRRIYASLQATQGLMDQVDAVVERHGGWPKGAGEGGAFSLNHRPPSAEVLAAQAAARPRARRRAAQPGQQSFLDADEEPEPAQKRAARQPKSPPASHGGAGESDLEDGAAMCALRAALSDAGNPLSRDALIRQAARALGHQRMSNSIAAVLDDAIRRAVRRGIAENRGGALGLLVRDIDRYERDHLKSQLLAALRSQRGWVEKADVPKVLARWLGYARTGAKISEATESLLRSLARSGQLELTADGIRVAKT